MLSSGALEALLFPSVFRTGKGEDGLGMAVPKEAPVHTVQLIASLTDCLFHMQRGKERGAPWDLGALQQADAACRHGAGKQGLEGPLPRGESVNSEVVAAEDASPASAPMS